MNSLTTCILKHTIKFPRNVKVAHADLETSLETNAVCYKNLF